MYSRLHFRQKFALAVRVWKEALCSQTEDVLKHPSFVLPPLLFDSKEWGDKGCSPLEQHLTVWCQLVQCLGNIGSAQGPCLASVLICLSQFCSSGTTWVVPKWAYPRTGREPRAWGKWHWYHIRPLRQWHRYWVGGPPSCLTPADNAMAVSGHTPPILNLLSSMTLSVNFGISQSSYTLLLLLLLNDLTHSIRNSLMRSFHTVGKKWSNLVREFLIPSSFTSEKAKVSLS